jgi:hypothetical protein
MPLCRVISLLREVLLGIAVCVMHAVNSPYSVQHMNLVHVKQTGFETNMAACFRCLCYFVAWFETDVSGLPIGPITRFKLSSPT